MDKLIQDSKEAEERLTKSIRSKDVEIEALKSEINRLNEEKLAEIESLENENMVLKTKLRSTVDPNSLALNVEKDENRQEAAHPSILVNSVSIYKF